MSDIHQDICFIQRKDGMLGGNKLDFGNGKKKKKNQIYVSEVWGTVFFVKFVSKALRMSLCCQSRKCASSQILSCINVNIMFVKAGYKLCQLWS